jgi:hypothetical protein
MTWEWSSCCWIVLWLQTDLTQVRIARIQADGRLTQSTLATAKGNLIHKFEKPELSTLPASKSHRISTSYPQAYPMTYVFFCAKFHNADLASAPKGH